MIKLIASDLDGTLLDSGKNLPADFFETFEELQNRGIVFTVASGRTYSAVDHLFPEEYRSRISFICDNGAAVYLRGELTHVSPLDRATFDELLDACESIGGFRLVVCAANGVYHLESSDDFFDEVGKFYRNHCVVDDLRNIDDTIFKLAVCDESGTYSHGKPELDKIFGERLNVQVSGEVWMDVMAANVSKGNALRALQNQLGVTSAETMAFGDYFNDLDMLMAADWSFCPENGHPEIKKQCRFICDDCDNSGVTKAIKQYACGEITL